MWHGGPALFRVCVGCDFGGRSAVAHVFWRAVQRAHARLTSVASGRSLPTSFDDSASSALCSACLAPFFARVTFVSSHINAHASGWRSLAGWPIIRGWIRASGQVASLGSCFFAFPSTHTGCAAFVGLRRGRPGCRMGRAPFLATQLFWPGCVACYSTTFLGCVPPLALVGRAVRFPERDIHRVLL
jgi:hypothetical protein